MIFDTLDRANTYTNLSEGLKTAFDYLRTTDLSTLGDKRIDLNEDVYLVPQRFTTRDPETRKWECHRNYLDIHYLVSGKERVGFADLKCMENGDCIPENDMYYVNGEGFDVVLTPGSFVVFYPQDAHAPGLAADQPAPIYKILVKVRV